MKYLWLIAALFCHSATAFCPDDDLPVTLYGTLVQHTFPGPPDWESIQDGDEAVENDFLKLVMPFNCAITSEEMSEVTEIQLIFTGDSHLTYRAASPWLNQDVIATGKTMYAQTGWHFTKVTLLVDNISPLPATLTPEQKKSMLLQFQQFQQVLKAHDGNSLKSFFIFPLPGEASGLLLPDGDDDAPEMLTEAEYDRHVNAIIARLHDLAEFNVNPDTLEIRGLSVNALTPEQQQYHYFPDDESGHYFYEKEGMRHTVEGACDTVADGEFEDDALALYQGTRANKQIPGLSEVCDGASHYLFRLVDGKLKLVLSFTAG